MSDYDPFGRDDHHGDPSLPDSSPMDADTCPGCDGFGYLLGDFPCTECYGSGVIQ